MTAELYFKDSSEWKILICKELWSIPSPKEQNKMMLVYQEPKEYSNKNEFNI